MCGGTLRFRGMEAVAADDHGDASKPQAPRAQETGGDEGHEGEEEDDHNALIVGLEGPRLGLRLRPACLDGTGAVVSGRDAPYVGSRVATLTAPLSPLPTPFGATPSVPRKIF